MASHLCTPFSLPLAINPCSASSCSCNSASASPSSSSRFTPTIHGGFSKSRRSYFEFGRGFAIAPEISDNSSARIGAIVAAADAAAANGAVAGLDELPANLQEIVKLFQQVESPRAKYEQLLHYAKGLKPLAKESCTSENKVEGCVSQVWVKPTLNFEEGTISFQAESDSVLTKGLAALLVEGLSGAKVADVLKLSPDFIQMLGLNQSLTPSRSNGFLNMLKLMQKKTLQMFMEAEAAGSKSGVAGAKKIQNGAKMHGSAVNSVVHESSGMKSNGANFTPSEAPKEGSIKAAIEKKLQEALSPTLLVVDDVSHQHAGHAGVHKGATETHFNVTVVSGKFSSTSLIKRHRLVYSLLNEELKNGVHALSLNTKAPSE